MRNTPKNIRKNHIDNLVRSLTNEVRDLKASLCKLTDCTRVATNQRNKKSDETNVSSPTNNQ